MKKKSHRLDQILLRRGWVNEEQIREGLQQQRRTGVRWGSALVEVGIITEAQLVEALSEQYGTANWDPLTVAPTETALKLFRDDWVRQKGIMPLAYDPSKNALQVAMADPNNVVLADEIRFLTNIRALTICVAPQTTLRRLWDQFYGSPVPSREVQKDAAGVAGTDSMPERLGLEFGFSLDRDGAAASEPDSAAKPAVKVLLWLAQPLVAKLLKSLLEVERCTVSLWDGREAPEGDWDYLVYDDDIALASPESLPRLKRALPRLQFTVRPSWIGALLRSPLSYDRLRDGYLQLTESVRRWTGNRDRAADRWASRYALAMARRLPLTPYETDTLLVACELSPLIASQAKSPEDHERIVQELGCPFPVADIFRAAPRPFAQLGLKPGQSAPEAPFTARVFAVVSAFLARRPQHPVNTIEAAGALAESLHEESGRLFDPLAVEALLHVVREEVLEGYLPPGPSEVLLVADRQVGWQHLVLLLENEGWRVVTANSASEARTLTERRRPDTVVWAAANALEWIRWQARSAPGIMSFLLLDEFEPTLARSALEAGFEDVWSGAWDPGMAAAKLRRAVQRKPVAQPKVEGVTGTLDHLSLIDMVQILAAGTRSVKIDLVHGHEHGRIILWQGQVRFAETPATHGEDAIYEMLTWHDAAFSFAPVDEMPAPNCTMPNEAILLEGCRRLDEGLKPATAQQSINTLDVPAQ
ncbi:MAG: DUF4388 domain-containing protein [candidate division Zixibacteria bacterium]|nr:DUF4388 domain-containing protein [candidate division Zixibacteria bacterium]